MSIPDEGFNTIDAWRARLHESVEKAAGRFIRAREALGPALRKAVFAYELDDKAVYEAFEYSRVNFSRAFAGVPYLLKDNFDVAGVPTYAGSSFLGEVRSIPNKHCRVYEAMRALGCVFGGKTCMSEFASSLSGENPFSGPCPNPHDLNRLSGGSSSGSAFAVAAGLVPFAFGTDTVGSVRVPASWCGVFGLRIQPGPLARDGVFPWAPSFDAPGWFTATAADMATLCHEMGHGTPRSVDKKKPALWCGDLFEIPQRSLQKPYQHLAECAGAVTDREATALLRPHFKKSAEAFDVLRDVEMYETQKPWFEKYAERYSPALRARIERAKTHTPQQVAQAKRAASDLSSALHEVFLDYDAMIWPTTPCVAPLIGQYTAETRKHLLDMNAPASLGRLPSLILPAAGEDGLSGGIQCVFPSEVRMDVPGVLRTMGYLQ